MDSEARQLQVRKKLLEEYVQHVLAIKMDHQAQLDKGDHPQQRSNSHSIFLFRYCVKMTLNKQGSNLSKSIYIYISVEEIYKTNLDELADVVDGDVEAAVRSVRRKADKALESLKTTDGNGNNKGIKNF